MFSFNQNTPQQQTQQQAPQPQSSTPFGGGFGTGIGNNQFSSPGNFSFGNVGSGSNVAPQQQSTPQTGGLFGQKPALNTGLQTQQPNNSFGTNPFGQQSQPQSQSQPQQQQQGSLFGSSTGSNAPFGTNNVNQSSGGFNQGQAQQQQQQQQQTQSTPGLFGTPQSSQFASAQHNSFGQQGQQQGSPFAHQGSGISTMSAMHLSPQQQQQQQNHQQQQHQQNMDQQRLYLEQQSQNMTYLPGYLSRTKVVKPYKLPARQLEPGSPEASHEADSSVAFGTPASKSGKEDTPSSKGQLSPVGRFSSSFFNERRDDSRAASAGPGTPWRGGRESIFGAGGLRGGRQSMTPAPAASTQATPARKSTSESPNRSIRSMSTPPAASTSLAAAAAAAAPGAMEEDDDEDAPPQDRLEDEAPAASMPNFSIATGSVLSGGLKRNGANNLSNPSTLSGRASSSGAALPSTSTVSATVTSENTSASTRDTGNGISSVLDVAQRTVLVYGYPHWMEKAVLELFAAIGGIESIEAIDVTGSGSAQDQAASNPNGPFLPCCVRIRYQESFQALHALRRNGEVVAGACIIGVRWEDDNFHHVGLTNGVDAVFRMEVFPSNKSADGFQASSKAIAIPAVNQSQPALSASGAGHSNGSSSGNHGAKLDLTNRHSIAFSPSGQATGKVTSPSSNGDNKRSLALSASNYPAFGRPLSVINDPSVAFKPSASTSNLASLANSPFKAASSLFGSSDSAAKPTTASVAQTGEKKSNGGVLGRIADGIFGW